MKSIRILLSCCFVCSALSLLRGNHSPGAEVRGSVVTEYLTSDVLRESRVGLDPRRSISVYLPPSYSSGEKRYPVIYYCHSFFWSNERMFAPDNTPQPLLDRAIANGVIGEFILVAANYSTSGPGSFYENSATSGRWLDFTVQELVPFIDRTFRTIAHRDSRGIAGEMIGAYGALKLAMLFPDVFSVAYGLHPFGTGSGLIPMHSRPNWELIHRAKSPEDLSDDTLSRVFLAMSQAYLPNSDRPPFYCDFIVERENGQLRTHLANTRKLQDAFLLDQMLPDQVENIRRLRGFAFDWGRYDTNQDHVYSNVVFSRELDELGVDHVAEEYRGGPWDKNWIEHGRVYSDLLPFFARLLRFE